MLPFLSQMTEGKIPPNAASFLPQQVRGPFEGCILESDRKMCLAVNTQDKTLTIKKWEDTQSSAKSFVISQANI